MSVFLTYLDKFLGAKTSHPDRLPRDLAKIHRWKKYTACYQHLMRMGSNTFRNLRPQNTLEHVVIIERFAELILLEASLWNQHYAAHDQTDKLFLVDEAFVLRALRYHDDGEAMVDDVDFANRTANHDANEYRAFLAQYSTLDPHIFAPIREAYLVQFALRPLSELEAFLEPCDLAVIEAWKYDSQKELEAVLFNLIERLDYVLYGLQLLRWFDNAHFLVWILRLQLQRIEQLVTLHPFLYGRLWDGECSRLARDFLAAHVDIPDESRVWEEVCQIQALHRQHLIEEEQLAQLPDEVREIRVRRASAQ